MELEILKTGRGANLVVPKEFLLDLANKEKVVTLDFQMPQVFVSNINKRLGCKVKFKPHFTTYKQNIEETKAELEDGKTLVLDWSEELDNPHNLNAWLYHAANLFKHEVEEDVKNIRKFFPCTHVNKRKNVVTDLKIYGVPVITPEQNLLDRLVYACYVNRIRYNKELFVYLVLLTLAHNAPTTPAGYATNPAGQVRKMLQGAVDRPVMEDFEGKVEELSVESSTEWWVPSMFYLRSPIAVEGQKFRVTHCTLTLAQGRYIWNKDRSGFKMNNSEHAPHAVVRSLPGAQSKIEKISNRSSLFYANRVEVCAVSKQGAIQVSELESPLKFATQENGLTFTHWQGKYHLANSCAGVYVDQTRNYVGLVYDTDVVNELTQENLIDELARELNIELDDADEPELDIFV